MMIRRDVGPAIHREQRERLAVLIFAPDACHAEPAIALQREEPFIEALLRLVGRIGEFVEAVAQDQAAMRRKIAPFRPEIIDGLARRSRPAPPPLDAPSSEARRVRRECVNTRISRWSQYIEKK